MSEKPLTPLFAKANRIYDADGREIAVATKADPKARAHADAAAAELVHRCNSHDALVGALEAYVHNSTPHNQEIQMRALEVLEQARGES